MKQATPKSDRSKVDQLITQSKRDRAERERGYRAQALKMYPWVCGRCEREFTHANVRELTVHHKDHNHDYNPPDGSNWELLCVYCHDNEHARQQDAEWTTGTADARSPSQPSLHKPFADLEALLKRNK